MARRTVLWGAVVASLLLGGLALYYVGWGSVAAAVGHSVEFNLARLSPEGESVGYAIPASGSSVPTVTAVCNADGSATFTWGAVGAVSYNYSLDNKTRGGWEFASRPCSASPVNGDYCGENVMTTSLTVGAGSVTPQEYAFAFHYNVMYWESGGADGGGPGSLIKAFLGLVDDAGSQGAQVMNTYSGGSASITCGDSTPPPTACSIAVGDCTIATLGGTCDATANWSATGVLDNQVKVALVWPNGTEDLWSRYGWPTLGYAPAVYSGLIAGFHTPGNYTAKLYDKSNNLCATDTFTVAMGPMLCLDNAPYIETNHASIKNYCDVNNDPDNNDTPPAGMTYPSSMTCNAAPGWQPYGPSCTLPNCDCTYVPVTGLPNLQSAPSKLEAVQGGIITKTPTFDVGETATFIATTWNVGDVEVPAGSNYIDRFQYRALPAGAWTNISPDITGAAPLGVWPAGAGGGAKNELVTMTFSTAGSYEVRHCTDVTSQVTESSETDNCSDSSGSVVTVTVNPGGGTSAVQGYKVNESMAATGFTSTLISAGGKSAVGNPYQITGLSAGSVTVTSAVPSGGYMVQHCVQSMPSKDCTAPAHYTDGESVNITLANGETKSVWWRYRPLNIDFKVAPVGTDPVTGSWSTGIVINDPNRDVKLKWDAPLYDRCEPVGGDFATGNQKTGNTGDVAGDPAGVAAGVAASGVLNEPGAGAPPKTYTIRCIKGSTPYTSSVTVTDAASLPPVVDLRAKATLMRSGQKAQLGWTVSGANSCTLRGGGLSYVTNTDFSRDENTNPYESGALTSTQVFTLACVNMVSGLVGSDTVRVEVIGQSQEI